MWSFLACTPTVMPSIKLYHSQKILPRAKKMLAPCSWINKTELNKHLFYICKPALGILL
jgi:hypothetical protein